MIRRPPRSTRTDTLLPYTTLFRSFGQVDFAVTDTLSLIAGGRYSWEKKTVDEFNQGSATTLPFNPNVPIPTVGATGSQSWSDFTPMVSIQFKPGQNKLVYATYSQGFKSGGYSVGSRLPVFKPETLTNYEVIGRAHVWTTVTKAH